MMPNVVYTVMIIGKYIDTGFEEIITKKLSKIAFKDKTCAKKYAEVLGEAMYDEDNNEHLVSVETEIIELEIQ